MEHIIRKELEKIAIESGNEILKKRNNNLKIMLISFGIVMFVLITILFSQNNQISFINNQVKILNNNSINQTLFNEVVKCRLECGR